ncbi:unnamed protein product [Staurois parvus]|uniref:Uncharacterized protein n=1 Tax=Staurois parvus TaxID=386267 RepID=A0ABN9B2G7_9NEOB|nr:unnamed protein product [Staurois parvus]
MRGASRFSRHMMSSHSNRACAAPGVRSTAIGGALCPLDTADHRSTEKVEDVGSVM